MGRPKHTVLIGGVKVTLGPEGDGWFDVATITVEPALRVGPAFVQAVLGRNPAGVKLDEILSDYERNCTVFLGGNCADWRRYAARWYKPPRCPDTAIGG